jgi:polyisoprenoid-binding protein YceI
MSLVKWDFDYRHSGLDFTVRHLLVSKVRGRFTKWSGEIVLDEQDVTRSRIDVEIDVASVDTHEPQRDTHLRSGDFFEVEKHPHMVFKSRTVLEKDKEHLSVTGDLTLRGKPARLSSTSSVGAPWPRILGASGALGSRPLRQSTAKTLA